jgi:hypothetical protein
MAKKNRFAQGDMVSGKRFNGDHFIGVYVHEYDCGDHLVTDGEKEFCVYAKDCHHAKEDEQKDIQEIIKAMKEKVKAKKNPKPIVEEPKEEDTTEIITEEELEQPLTEE